MRLRHPPRLIDCHECGLPAELVSVEQDEDHEEVYLYRCVVEHEKYYAAEPKKPRRRGRS